jgi:hypothetical protein
VRDPRARLRGMAGRLVLVSGGRLLVYGGRLETPPWHTEPQAEARPQGPSAAIVQFSLSQALGARPKKKNHGNIATSIVGWNLLSIPMELRYQ